VNGGWSLVVGSRQLVVFISSGILVGFSGVSSRLSSSAIVRNGEGGTSGGSGDDRRRRSWRVVVVLAMVVSCVEQRLCGLRLLPLVCCVTRCSGVVRVH